MTVSETLERRVEELERELAAISQDAARYRWLRENRFIDMLDEVYIDRGMKEKLA